MEESAQILSEILIELQNAVRPSVSLKELESLAEKLIKQKGVTSINKGYKTAQNPVKFPSVICIGVNDTIAHGIPSIRVLQEGDLVTLDMGIKYKGFSADAGLTVPVGKISGRDERLLYYTKKCIYEALKVVKPGALSSEIGRVIEKYVLLRGFVPNYMLGGHFIGKEMHVEPFIPNFDYINDPLMNYKIQKVFKVGDVFCIEPMITYKDKFGYQTEDGWTVKTRDGKNSAFFEHMVEVTEDGYKILTNHFSEMV